MPTIIARRLLLLIPTLFIVSFLAFGLQALVPGDIAVQLAGGTDATPQAVAQVKEQLGLDDPFLVQYWHWLSNAVQGDFGNSLRTGQPVTQEIGDRLPITFEIVLAGMVVGLLIAVPVGIVSGMRAGTRLDRALVGGTVFGTSIPNFFLALLLILFFAIELGWFPSVVSIWTPFADDPVTWLKQLVLPAFALGIAVAAGVARQIRAALAETMNSNYVRTAWAKGGRTSTVVGKHAMKNAAIPAVTVLGLSLGGLLGGTVLIEQIFAIPGIGQYVLSAMFSQDMPVIQAVVLMFAIITALLALLVDLSYTILNPTVRRA
ncbi:MAG TPA: ABC transporter permease [Acidimicrobiia bacterium]|nr:ABC transporter permease [Acidimicrobiia bacterium]